EREGRRQPVELNGDALLHPQDLPHDLAVVVFPMQYVALENLPCLVGQVFAQQLLLLVEEWIPPLLQQLLVLGPGNHQSIPTVLDSTVERRQQFVTPRAALNLRALNPRHVAADVAVLCLFPAALDGFQKGMADSRRYRSGRHGLTSCHYDSTR